MNPKPNNLKILTELTVQCNQIVDELKIETLKIKREKEFKLGLGFVEYLVLLTAIRFTPASNEERPSNISPDLSSVWQLAGQL